MGKRPASKPLELGAIPLLRGERVALDPARWLWALALEAALEDLEYRRSGLHPPGEEIDDALGRRDEEIGDGRAAILTLTVDGQIAGLFELSILNPDSRSLRAGYWVAPGRRGNRYGVEGLRVLRDWVETSIDAERIELHIHPDNGPSLGLAAAAGFTERGPCQLSPAPPRGAQAVLFDWRRPMARDPAE